MMRESRALEYLVSRAQQGDSWAHRRVVEIMAPLVGHFAKRFFPPGTEYQDVVGEANLGLLKAIRMFNPSRGASFRTFANICIHSQLCGSLKHYLGVNGYKKGLHVLVPNSQIQELLIDGDHAHVVTHETSMQSDLAECYEWLEQHASGLERDCALLALQRKTYSAIARELSAKYGRKLDEKSVDNALCRMRRKAIHMRTQRASEFTAIN